MFSGCAPCCGDDCRRAGCVFVRGLRLTMANNPKKAKDPTEVALSAIQEALNISEPEPGRNSAPPVDLDMPPPPPVMPSAAPSYSDPAPSYSEPDYEPRASAADRPMFDPIEEPRVTRRAANDDRETIGQLLQSLQKGRPARSVYTPATIFAGIWLAGCALLTASFIGSLQAAIGQSGGGLVRGGLAALFFAPV